MKAKITIALGLVLTCTSASATIGKKTYSYQASDGAMFYIFNITCVKLYVRHGGHVIDWYRPDGQLRREAGCAAPMQDGRTYVQWNGFEENILPPLSAWNDETKERAKVIASFPLPEPDLSAKVLWYRTYPDRSESMWSAQQCSMPKGDGNLLLHFKADGTLAYSWCMRNNMRNNGYELEAMTDGGDITTVSPDGWIQATPKVKLSYTCDVGISCDAKGKPINIEAPASTDTKAKSDFQRQWDEAQVLDRKEEANGTQMVLTDMTCHQGSKELGNVVALYVTGSARKLGCVSTKQVEWTGWTFPSAAGQREIGDWQQEISN